MGKRSSVQDSTRVTSYPSYNSLGVYATLENPGIQNKKQQHLKLII